MVRKWCIRTAVLIMLIYIGSGAYFQWEFNNLWSKAPTENITSTEFERTEFEGLVYTEKITLTLAIRESERDRKYPWAGFLSTWQAIGLVTIACGAGGGFFREAYTFISGGKQHNWMYLGLVMGPSLLIGVFGLHELLFQEGQLRANAVVALSFLGGCFSEESYDFLHSAYVDVSKKVLK